MVQVFTGNGRGKTSAALGSALRAAGQKLKVYVVQFMKGTYPYGEHVALKQLQNITVARFGHLDFVDPENVTRENKEEAQKALDAALTAISSNEYDLVILDEVNVAVAWELIPLHSLIALIDQKPANVDVILTGRYAAPEIIDLADLVTEMVEKKHPYQKGIQARRGFEY